MFGIDVIWLLLIYVLLGDDNGYDISDYQVIDLIFGMLDEVDFLIVEVYCCGICIVMDLVVNYIFDEYLWFVELVLLFDLLKCDWYWRWLLCVGYEFGIEGVEFSNWVFYFQGLVWQFDLVMGEYYLYFFLCKQFDFNWENFEVCQVIYCMMIWWFDCGVDGFCMDVINLILKDMLFLDGVVVLDVWWGDGVLYVVLGLCIYEFLWEMYDMVFVLWVGDYVIVGEMLGVMVEQVWLFIDLVWGEFDMVFQFEYVDFDYGLGGKFVY